jgi:hypothetical protein
MSIDKLLLGKIFISHSSIDKPFVRQIAEGIEEAGFKVWLDERELMPGDAVAGRISEALANSRAVIVVVSEASIRSKWLAFELTQATERMVQGNCRVIPVVKDRVSLPPEVAGLLYADFTQSFDLGLKGVLTALHHDAHRVARKHSFWARCESLVEGVFDATGYESVGGEYKSEDYSVAYVDLPQEQAGVTDAASEMIPYEIVSGYVEPQRPLNEQWWNEYESAIDRSSASLFLVVTERPIGFPTLESDANKRVRYKTRGWKEHVSSYVVFVELSGIKDDEQSLALMRDAKSMFITFAQALAAN